MEKLLFQTTYKSEFAPQSAELTDYAETIGVEKESTLARELPFPPFLFILAI